MARETGDVPIIKPVRYDAGAIDLRPETPKDMKDATNANTPEQPTGLTPRQHEIMNMVLAGTANKNIAADLGITQRTVEAR